MWRTVNHAAPAAVQSALQASANHAELMKACSMPGSKAWKQGQCSHKERARCWQYLCTRPSPSTLPWISGLLALPCTLQHRRWLITSCRMQQHGAACAILMKNPLLQQTHERKRLSIGQIDRVAGGSKSRCNHDGV